MIRFLQNLVRSSKGASCSLTIIIYSFRWSEPVVHASLSNSGTGRILYCTFFWWFDWQMTQFLRIDYVGELKSWYKVITWNLPLQLWSAMNPIASNQPWVMSLDVFQTFPFHWSFALSFHFYCFCYWPLLTMNVMIFIKINTCSRIKEPVRRYRNIYMPK